MRRAPYSKDLRWRIVWERIALDLTFERIAQNLCVSVGTVYNVFKLFQATGEVDPQKPPKRERKLDGYHSLYIIGLLLAYPMLHLSELVEKVQEISGTVVSTSSICRLLASHGFTRKKVQHVALQRRIDYRASYWATIFHFTRDMLVWVDETGSNLKDMLRTYGYALCGERAVSRQILIRGQRVSSVAAICTDGILAVDMTMESMNGEKFYDFIRGSLIPELLPFNGSNPRSVVIMDNCSIHHIQEIIDLFDDVGILLIFLPPYSPDLNPIELTFGYIKQYLKLHEDIMHTIPQTHILQTAFNNINTAMCDSWIKHCGY